MAQWISPTAEMVDSYLSFRAELPAEKLAIFDRFNPWSLYREKKLGLRGIVMNVTDDGRLILFVPSDLNGNLTVSLQLRGVPFNELYECDMPTSQDLIEDARRPVSIVMDRPQIDPSLN